MKTEKTLAAAAFGVFLAFGFANVSVADNVGKMEYENNCAVCHGMTGKGDGPYAGIIDTKVPDMTMLQKNNNGVFPFDRVYQAIDGRLAVKAHGTRDMPIWGNEYNGKAALYYSDYLRDYSAEGFVRGRILALVNHIYTLQAK
jgi:mono/diheme cytochrome c family protein